jgi:hypothetical protein
MGINDPIRIEYRKKQKEWIVKQGNETFYDTENYMYTFESAAQAMMWAINNLSPNLIDEGTLQSAGIEDIDQLKLL